MDRENYIKQILELKTDEEKMKMLKTLTLDEQIIVIKSLSDENIKKYIGKFKYQYYFESLLDGIKDEMYKIEQFKKTKDLYTKLSIISETSNRDFQYKLISMLDGSIYKDLLKTNYNKQDFVKDINLNVKYDVDPDITFGVELEAYNPDCEYYKVLKNILVDWKFVNELSVKYGLELVSPILKFDENSLKELFYVCSMLQNNNFIANYNCGGHIHFGFDYIKNKQHLINFINLYTNTQDVLYTISNRSGNCMRSCVNKYAVKIDRVATKLSYINFDKIKSLEECAKIVRETQLSRYYGLNLTRIGQKEKNTIEFRFPNGELDFNELIHNIRLFSKLLEKSLNLDDCILYDNRLKNDEKIEILLDILFDNEEDKNIYRDRYYNNKTFFDKYKYKKPIKL